MEGSKRNKEGAVAYLAARDRFGYLLLRSTLSFNTNGHACKDNLNMFSNLFVSDKHVSLRMFMKFLMSSEGVISSSIKWLNCLNE